MIHPVRRLSHALLYDLRLQYKFLISQISLILLPLIVLGFFLYAQLYDIIVSSTVLSEQALAAQTATALENALSRVTQASDTLSENELIASLFPEAEQAAGYDEVQVLAQLAESLTDGSLITQIRIYADFSWDAGGWDEDGGLIAPLSSITSTYWYGIFSSQEIDGLYCPDLYLSATEEELYGALAYIRRIRNPGRPERRTTAAAARTSAFTTPMPGFSSSTGRVTASPIPARPAWERTYKSASRPGPCPGKGTPRIRRRKDAPASGTPVPDGRYCLSTFRSWQRRFHARPVRRPPRRPGRHGDQRRRE